MFLNSILLLIILMQGYTIYQIRSTHSDKSEIKQTAIKPPVVQAEGDNGSKGENRGV